MHWQASKVAALLLGMAIKSAHPNRGGEYSRSMKARFIMKKSYCTQNNGNCETCSLVSYGLDCGNNPITISNPRKGTKADRALKAYDGFKGGATVEHIKKLIGKELTDKLTGHELGLVMSAVNRAYQEGKSSTGAEVVDGEYVWVNCIDKGIDLDVLRRLKKTETPVCNKIYYDGNLNNVSSWRYKTYDGMPYDEQRTVREMQSVPRDKWGEWYHEEHETAEVWELIEK
jgi:hypothetical protein